MSTSHNELLCGAGEFCTELSYGPDTLFEQLYGEKPTKRRILTTRSFAVVVDLSPLMIGHLLILPREHYLSFANLPLALIAEFQEVVARIAPLYSITFGNFTFLEHGSSPADDRSACITHAHLHMVPLAYSSVRDRMEADGLSGITLDSYQSLPSSGFSSAAYYLAGEPDRLVAFRPFPHPPRQYIRSVIGRVLGMRDPEWDYSLFPRPEIFYQTLTRTSLWELRS